MSVPASKEESGGVLQGSVDDRLAPASADVTITDLPAPGSVEAAEQPLLNKPTTNHLQKLQVSHSPPFILVIFDQPPHKDWDPGESSL